MFLYLSTDKVNISLKPQIQKLTFEATNKLNIIFSHAICGLSDYKPANSKAQTLKLRITRAGRPGSFNEIF